MSRRWSGLVLAALLLVSLVMASCSTTAGPATSTKSTESDKPNGSLIIEGFFREFFVDAKTRSVATAGPHQSITSAIFDDLVRLSPDGQQVPGIAERWEISQDGKSHTFYIRKGVKFHDGSDLTGADVKFTIDNFIAVSTASAANTWRATIDSVVLKDDYTVVLNLKTPSYELLTGINNMDGSGAIFPKKYIEENGWDAFARNLVGSGPWKVTKAELGSRMEIEAVENHWRAVPKFKNITLIPVPEEGTKAAMLKTGGLDLAQVSPDSVTSLKAAGVRVIGHYGASQWWAAPFYDQSQPQSSALSDVRVRKALSLAVDRKELADKVYSGFAQPSAIAFAPKTAYFFDSNVLKPDPFDPDQAKKLLAEAGYASGFTTKLWDPGAGGWMSTGNLALVGYWRKLGINVDLAPIDYSTVYGWISPKTLPNIYNTIFGYSNSGGTFQFERMATAFHSTKGWFKNLKNPKLDELIEKVPTITDPVEKKKSATEAAVLGKNEFNVLPILDTDTLFAVSSKIGQITPVKGMAFPGPAYETLTHGK